MVGLDPTIHAVPNDQPSPTTACATKTGQTGPPQKCVAPPSSSWSGSTRPSTPSRTTNPPQPQPAPPQRDRLDRPGRKSPPPARHGRARPDHPRRPERPTLPNHSLRHQNGTDWTAPNVSRPPPQTSWSGSTRPSTPSRTTNPPQPQPAPPKRDRLDRPKRFSTTPPLVMAGLVPAIHAVPSDQPPPIKGKHQRSKKNETKPTAPDVSRPPPTINPASSHPTAQKPPKHPLAQSPPTTPPNHSHFLNPSPVS